MNTVWWTQRFTSRDEFLHNLAALPKSIQGKRHGNYGAVRV
jgi:hypothetical protein